MIRVMYTFEVDLEGLEAFESAWRQIVEAHRSAGHGAIESVLLRDPERPSRFFAISRWGSRELWEKNRTDDAHPEAYAVFRQHVEVLERRVLDERIALP